MFVVSKNRFTLLAFLVYVLILVGGVICINKYIQHKKKELHKEMQIKFINQCEVHAPVYWYRIVKDNVQSSYYSRLLYGKSTAFYNFALQSTPTKTTLEFVDGKMKSVEHELYKGIKQYYETYSNARLAPWILEIARLEPDRCYVDKSYAYPFAIGVRNRKKLTPTEIDKVLLVSLNSIKSQHTHRIYGIQRGFFPESWKNEYFEMQAEDGEDDFDQIAGTSLALLDDQKRRPRDDEPDHYIDVGDFRIYMAVAKAREKYILRHNDQNRKHDSLKYHTVFISIVTCAFLIVYLLANNRQNKKTKRLHETLYDRLLRVCHPQNYMESYDKAKVEYATELYQQLLNTNQDDLDSINSLYESAREKLGVNVLDNDRLDEMQKLANPRLFMKPFNEKKVSIANTIYGSLVNRKELSYEQYVKLEKMLTELYKD